MIAVPVRLLALDLEGEIREFVSDAEIEHWSGTGWVEDAEPDLVFWSAGQDSPEALELFDHLKGRALRMVLVGGDGPGQGPGAALLHHVPVPFSPAEIGAHVRACLQVATSSVPN
ncbi:hypothetical protein OG2516_05318 [Oceanicola granulosus HTCC2516]|uniref:Uncharacterized protein n=1 Tax=Oceanicola granulosus (strain ATCC BAA-861 / DSM 15982 / KCTC 12143 / HTCC2516) TaxID=314256 RepID=Q2CIT8_OCEGH|nr:hypothetical protein OG2516_05318 [Oceanicola granulosus HTCC2516]